MAGATGGHPSIHPSADQDFLLAPVEVDGDRILGFTGLGVGAGEV